MFRLFILSTLFIFADGLARIAHTGARAGSGLQRTKGFAQVARLNSREHAAASKFVGKLKQAKNAKIKNVMGRTRLHRMVGHAQYISYGRIAG